MKRLPWIGLAVTTALLAACSRPAMHAKAPAAPAPAAKERAGPVQWNAASGGFELNGRPLKTAKLWKIGRAHV